MTTNENIWDAISSIQNIRHRAYFQWKNKIVNTKKDYSKMTEEELVESLNGSDELIKHMKRWESTPEFKRLMCLLKEDSFAMDLIDTYEEVKKKAKEGDSQAIKNMIMLQKEIKKYRKSIDKFFETEKEEEKDDGLII